jgi:beta-xylosidase
MQAYFSKGILMRIQMVLAAASVMALAACDSSVGGPVADPTDPAQVEAAFNSLAKPTPGEYSSKSELIEFAMPGASEEEAQMMRSLMELGTSQEMSMCITQEQLDEGFQQYIDSLKEFDETCEYTSLDVSNSQFNGTMNCKEQSGASGTVEFNGSITDTEQDITVSMDMSDPASGAGMQMKLRTVTKRVGDCTG